MKKAFFYLFVIPVLISCFGSNLKAERLSKAQRLSKEESRRFLQVYLQRENPFKWAEKNPKYGLFYGIGFKVLELDKYKDLEKKGSVIIKVQDDPFLSQGFQKDIRIPYGIQFTNKPASYLPEPSGGWGDKIYVELTNVKNFDIVDFKKIAANEQKADLLVGYKLTPFGDILLGRGIMVQRKEGSFIEAYDEGWRVKFKINF